MPNIAGVQREEAQGYVLGAADGERLINRGGDLFIKVDPGRGSQNVSLGTQQVPPGVGIPRHRHAHMDEFIYVIEGSGTFVLNDERHPIEKGGTIFIPKGVWHAFENPDGELVILWAVSPIGQEEFFRAISSRPGEVPKHLTAEETLAIRQQVEADQLKRLESQA
jgi:quercetin dioxygenase-like cupin family protein